MSSESLTGQELTEKVVRIGSELDSLDVRSRRATELCAEWFGAGVRESGKQYVYAERIGVASSVLTEMLTLKRPIYLRDTLPLLSSLVTAKPFVDWQGGVAGLAPAIAMTDTVTLSQGEARLLSWLRRTAIWTLFLGEMLAREFYRCDRDLLEVAIEQTLRIGK